MSNSKRPTYENLLRSLLFEWWWIMADASPKSCWIFSVSSVLKNPNSLEYCHLIQSNWYCHSAPLSLRPGRFRVYKGNYPKLFAESKVICLNFIPIPHTKSEKKISGYEKGIAWKQAIFVHLYYTFSNKSILFCSIFVLVWFGVFMKEFWRKLNKANWTRTTRGREQQLEEPRNNHAAIQTAHRAAITYS